MLHVKNGVIRPTKSFTPRHETPVADNKYLFKRSRWIWWISTSPETPGLSTNGKKIKNTRYTRSFKILYISPSVFLSRKFEPQCDSYFRFSPKSYLIFRFITR